MLENLNNYGMFAELVQTGHMTINTDDINIANWDFYYHGCLAVMQDGIDTKFVQRAKVDIIFGETKEHCKLSLPDLYFNLIMWYMIVRSGEKLSPKHLFFDDVITKKTIKKYIDDLYIIPNRKRIDFKEINNTIDDALHNYMDVDIFSMYLANTINLEDFISLAKKSDRFNAILHADLSQVPLADVKNEGMRLAHESIKIIEDSERIMEFEHCLADSFRAGEGINPKQYKEFAISVGTKPDGKGGAHPAIINHSYLNGGLSNILYQFIDSASSRFAQIISKNNVGDSGNFARIVGLNNINTFLYPDPDYDCHTHNFVELTITSDKMLKLYIDRYYRFDPDGEEFLIHPGDEFLIGRKIYLRSPITCASEARGHGVCYKCYGDLAYVNSNIKPGKMSAELITAKTTQERLSSKHLLETKIKQMHWNAGFFSFFNVQMDAIYLKSEKEDGVHFDDDMFILIDPNDITLENADDYEKTDYMDDEDENSSASRVENEIETNYNEYVRQFYVGKESDPNNLELIQSEESTPMYISVSLNDIIRSSAKPTKDNKIKIKFEDLEDSPLFFVKIVNSEFGKSLTDIQNLLDKKSITQNQTIHSITQKIIQAAIEGNMGIMAVHFEILIMNQIRNVNSNLHKPNWDTPNEEYRILTLKQSLMDNPSVTVSLLFQYLGRQLSYPLTYKKNKPSFMDLFFARRPQRLLADMTTIDTSQNTKNKVKINIATKVHRRK